MNRIQDDILSYWEMCDAEGKKPLQRGMNYRFNPTYSVILLSQRSNAPYKDKIYEDGITLEYEGHDLPRNYNSIPKNEDQPTKLPSGTLTQNGLFIKAVEEYKNGKQKVELVKAYEKIMDGVWSLKGVFELVDYKLVYDGKRNVFRFILKLTSLKNLNGITDDIKLFQTRLIPSQVKQEVWKRDEGRCVLCGSKDNLHFDHDLPFSKGGTSLSVKNVRLLCMKHNLQKSGRIE